MNKIIYQFAIKVMAHDYQESLNILKDLIANLENHDEDNIIFLYVILLKELVQIEKLDSKIVENLYYTYQEKDELFNNPTRNQKK